LQKYKNTHSKEKMEIQLDLCWKYDTLLIGDGAVVSNECFYHNFTKVQKKYRKTWIRCQLYLLFKEDLQKMFQEVEYFKIANQLVKSRFLDYLLP